MPKNFKDTLSDMMLSRLTLIPWHHTNAGVDVEREHVWILETLFEYLQVKKSGHYLCAYDTLGFFTHLLLHFAEHVVYHSTVDKYDFPDQPTEKWITEIRHLPPKIEALNAKYDGIVVANYFCEAGEEMIRVVLSYLKKMLKPGGVIVCTSRQPKDRTQDHPRWYDEIDLNTFHGLKTVQRRAAPTVLTGTSHDHFVVLRLEATE